MTNDLRYALRMMRRTPVFTAAVILTIALAIGANTAVFSVVNTVIIRPMPFADPSRLVQVAEKNDRLNLSSFGASVLNFLSWREQQQSFEELAAIGFASYTISSGGEPEQLTGNRISPALTRVLGIAPVRRLLCGGAADCSDWDLRRAGLFRHTAHARDWIAHGAGGSTRRRAAADHRRRHADYADRSVRRIAWWSSAGSSRCQPGLWRPGA